MKKDPFTQIDFYSMESNDIFKFKLITSDRVGLLYSITQILYLSNMDILDVVVSTINNKAVDVFTIRKRNKLEFTKKNIEDLKNLILKYI